MKKILLLLVAALMASSISAGVVDEAAAKRKAQKFLTERATAELRKANPGSKAVATNVKVELVETRTTADGTPALYTFNARDGKGFVMIPANDVYGEVLGFSATGTIDPENMPPALEALLTRFAANASDDGWYNMPFSQRDTLLLHPVDSIAPMVKTKWSQLLPYNWQAPTYWSYNQESNNFVVNNMPTGCVATAMAQLLYWHHYTNGISFDVTSQLPEYQNDIIIEDTQYVPEWLKEDTYDKIKTLQDSAYKCTYDWDNKKITLLALDPTAFDWDKMTPTYESDVISDQTAGYAVAKLMRYCGQAVKMGYGERGSGSDTENISRALNTYFSQAGYTAYYYNSNDFLFQDYRSKLITEVSKRPISLGGYGTGGHEFILDGVGYLKANKEDVCFHLNWGWGGFSDGWFRLELLNPKTKGHDNYSEGTDFVTLAPNDEQSSHSGDATTLTLEQIDSISIEDYTAEYKYPLTDTLAVKFTCTNKSEGANSGKIYPVALRIDDSRNTQSTASPVAAAIDYDFKAWTEDTVGGLQPTVCIKYSDVMAYMNTNKLDTCMVSFAIANNGGYKVIATEQHAYYFIATANRDSVIVRPNIWLYDNSIDSITTEIADGNYTVSYVSLRLQNIVPNPIGGKLGVICKVLITTDKNADSANIMPFDDSQQVAAKDTIANQDVSYEGYITGNKLLYVCFPSQQNVWSVPLSNVTAQDSIERIVWAANKQLLYWQKMSLKDFFNTTSIDEVTIVPVTIVDDAIYDLNGRRLMAVPEQGVYIRGGKKYLAR